MSDIPERPASIGPDEAPSGADERFSFTNLEGAKQFARDAESIQQFRLQTSLDLYDRLTSLNSAGSAIYEKLILLDGAIIALSITFLGSLSSRLAMAHVTQRPHLWLVTVSWLLLIASVYCCYRVLVDRHGAMLRHLTSVSSERHQYIFQRLGRTLTGMASTMKGGVSVGAEKVELSKVFEGLSAALKQEGDAAIKKMGDSIIEGQKTYKEGLFAKLAINLTIAGVIVLCIFTILSLQKLF